MHTRIIHHIKYVLAAEFVSKKMKKTLRHRLFSVNFARSLKMLFLQNTSKHLILSTIG